MLAKHWPISEISYKRRGGQDRRPKIRLRNGLLVGCGITAGAVPVLVAAGGSSAGSSAGTSGGAVPVGTYTQDQAVADGYLKQQDVQLPDGGSEYVFSGSDPSTSLKIPVPPSGFTPLTATPVQLEEYGFPPRPSGGPALQNWIQAMQAYKGTPTPTLVVKVFAATDPTNQAQPAAQPPPGALPAGSIPSGNWSGWTGVGGPTTYVALSGDSSVPVATGAGCSNQRMTDWTGLGGSSMSLPLIQSGIDFNNLVTDAWVPFYEVMEANGAGNIHSKIGNPAVHLNDGDGVYMYTDYQQSNSQADFYIEDTTTGTVSSLEKTGVSSSYYDGSTADWINEDFLGNNLKQYSPFGWKNMQALLSNGNWKSPGSVENNKYLTVRNGHNVQYPSALSGGSAFTQYWAACN